MRVLTAVLLIGAAWLSNAADVERVDSTAGISRAVIAAQQPLVHTTQLLPLDASGQIVGKADARAQVSQALANLENVLKATGSGFARLVKVNVYVRAADVVPAVHQAFAQRFAKAAPAVCFVEGELAHSGALVSLDAVATTAKVPAQVECFTVKGVHAVPGGSHAAILPPGKRVYISGMASKGDVGVAAADTMKQLWSVLEFLKLRDAEVVQLKAFLTPMAKREDAERAMAALFAGRKVPPIIFVEWVSKVPIEIELIAAAGPEDKSADVIEYLTPPGVKASPVYSRVARINSGQTVFISGLYPKPGQSAPDQIRDIFGQLKSLGDKTGTNLRHLAKATYYVSADDTSAELNKIRPEYYDPARPPAASKAQVRGVARDTCRITLDMIAAQKK
ncbi:MAG: RidA family protein [Verrucomicrobiota bacterium]